jgi:hypothetical protein
MLVLAGKWILKQAVQGLLLGRIGMGEFGYSARLFLVCLQFLYSLSFFHLVARRGFIAHVVHMQ